MKASVYYERGAPSVLLYEERPDPVPAAREVLIQVDAISIEGGDLLNRLHSPPLTIPHIVGYQAAGVVVGIGAEVTRFKPGDRVAAFNFHGSHAELWTTSEDLAYRVPDGLSLDVASTIPVTFGTADDALFEFGHLQAGHVVLIQGAAGGVGIAAIQLAHQAGATVVVTASSTERLDKLRSYGADFCINYKTDDVVDSLLQITDRKGADLVVDLAGGAVAKALLKALRYRGRMSLVGNASGELARFSFLDLNFSNLTICGIAFGREMHTPRVHALIDRHLAGVANGRLQMPIDRIFALADAPNAHEYVGTGHPFGRVLMKPKAGGDQLRS
jgi:NADPH:quinone reductase-like Zn-dependent oxidoreductase